jgi:UDPglucose 6-dehydrogenase
VREASSLTMIELLLKAGANIRAYDPIANDNIRKSVSADQLAVGRLTFCEEQYDALDGADAMILMTEWKQFRNPDFDRMKRTLRAAVIFDGRNQYDPLDLRELGFEYYGIGRGQARSD